MGGSSNVQRCSSDGAQRQRRNPSRLSLQRLRLRRLLWLPRRGGAGASGVGAAPAGIAAVAAAAAVVSSVVLAAAAAMAATAAMEAMGATVAAGATARQRLR